MNGNKAIKVTSTAAEHTEYEYLYVLMDHELNIHTLTRTFYNFHCLHNQRHFSQIIWNLCSVECTLYSFVNNCLVSNTNI